MPFELTVDHQDVDLSEVGGKGQVFPGDYHLLVESVNEDGGQMGEMIVDFQVLRGVTGGMEGRPFQQKFSKDMKKWPIRKMCALAIAARLTTKEELDRCKKSGQSPMIDWNKMVGRSVCMQLEDDEYNGRHYTRLAWDNIWSPIDKRASHIPLHAKALERDGLKLPEGRHIDGILHKPQAGGNGGKGQGGTGGGQQASGGNSSGGSTKPASADDALDGVI